MFFVFVFRNPGNKKACFLKILGPIGLILKVVRLRKTRLFIVLIVCALLFGSNKEHSSSSSSW